MPARLDSLDWIGDLLGATVIHRETRGAGRNSRVERLTLTDGKQVALKHYPRHPWDEVDRYANERNALQFLADIGEARVPLWLGGCEAQRLGLLSWLPGISSRKPTRSDLEVLVDFIEQLFRASASFKSRPPAKHLHFGLASAACTNIADLAGQIDKRRQALLEIGELNHFLETGLSPVLHACLSRLANGRNNFPLPPHHLRLIPADLGFHNALLTPPDRWYFVDFEYFGWDDPVRLFADLVLHPGHDLSDNKSWLVDRLLHIPYLDKDLPCRFERHLPLFALRWALIVLNEFIPERQNARQKVMNRDAATASWEDIKRGQLAKAEHFVALASHYLNHGTLQ